MVMLVWNRLHSWICNFHDPRNAKRMPIDVQDALRAVSMKHGRLSKEESDAFIKKLEGTKRLQLETWA